MKEIIMRLVREEDGQAMTEYGLILALIAVAVIGTLTLLGTQISNLFEGLKGKIVGPAQ